MRRKWTPFRIIITVLSVVLAIIIIGFGLYMLYTWWRSVQNPNAVTTPWDVLRPRVVYYGEQVLGRLST